MTTADLQRRLRALGQDPGKVDGIPGPRTSRAFAADLKARYGVVFEVTTRSGLFMLRGPIPQPPVPAPPTPKPATFAVRQGKAGHLVTEIVLHCSATYPGWLSSEGLTAKMREIERWHLERGWRAIGYHYVIDRNGALGTGRPETEIGAGVLGHNQGVIHICLLGGGGSSADDAFLENFTQAQDSVVRRLIADISRRTPIRRVSGHNEWARKACPGFHVPTWLKGA